MFFEKIRGISFLFLAISLVIIFEDLRSGDPITDPNLLIRQYFETNKSFYEDMKTWESNDMRENDERVYKAIIVLFESKDDIEIFNKKAIYLYLREITGLNTKQVVNSLNKFRDHYRDFKSDWENGKI